MNQIVYVGKHLLMYSVSRHAHASWEFVYCTSGSGEFMFDDFTLHYEEGDITVIPPYMPHSNISDKGFSNLYINMSNPKLAAKGPFVVRDESNKFILNAFTAAFYHFSSALPQRGALLSAYGDLIACYLVAFQKAPFRSEVVDEIENSIIQNYPDCNFELDAYLRSFPFSYDYLRKLFKKELGVTPHKYLSDKRLQAAAESLCSATLDGRNVTEIAYQCGFREPLYFSRMFKKKYGMSPSRYQRENHSEAAPASLDADSMKISLGAEGE